MEDHGFIKLEVVFYYYLKTGDELQKINTIRIFTIDTHLDFEDSLEQLHGRKYSD